MCGRRFRAQIPYEDHESTICENYWKKLTKSRYTLIEPKAFSATRKWEEDRCRSRRKGSVHMTPIPVRGVKDRPKDL